MNSKAVSNAQSLFRPEFAAGKCAALSYKVKPVVYDVSSIGNQSTQETLVHRGTEFEQNQGSYFNLSITQKEKQVRPGDFYLQISALQSIRRPTRSGRDLHEGLIHADTAGVLMGYLSQDCRALLPPTPSPCKPCFCTKTQHSHQREMQASHTLLPPVLSPKVPPLARLMDWLET